MGCWRPMRWAPALSRRRSSRRCSAGTITAWPTSTMFWPRRGHRSTRDGWRPTGERGRRMLSRLEGLPIVHGEIPSLEPHRLVFRYGVCIDAVYHLPATYTLAARWRDDAAWRARRWCRRRLHGRPALRVGLGAVVRPTRKANNGVAWTRGMGWAVLGLLDLVEPAMAVERRGRDLAGQVLERLAATQQPDGNWARCSTTLLPAARPRRLRSTLPPRCTPRRGPGYVAAGGATRATEACHRVLRRRRHLHRCHHRRPAELGHHDVRALPDRALAMGAGCGGSAFAALARAERDPWIRSVAVDA